MVADCHSGVATHTLSVYPWSTCPPSHALPAAHVHTPSKQSRNSFLSRLIALCSPELRCVSRESTSSAGGKGQW